MSEQTGSGLLVHMGNPLLDLQVRDGEAVLQKYNLKANDAILVDESQADIYDYVRENYQVVYVAGGASQNAARAAQYCSAPGTVSYIGCVGDDELADQLRAANDKEGLTALYQVQPKGQESTGACACIITGHNRSLVTKLGAAEKFSSKHLQSSAVSAAITKAKFFYVEGFFVTHGMESILIMAQHAHAADEKTFALNLSAPFVAQFFKDQVNTVMPYVDYLFGNEDELDAYATANGWEVSDRQANAQKLANSPKNSARARTVVITQGASSTLVAVANQAQVKVYPVTPLPEDKIEDTNGAGDAFAGAFMAALVANKSVDEAVEAGHKLAQICVGQVGPTFGSTKQPIL